MSASLNAIPAGQPSTTQPIAGPWLSPKVVTRKRWPNVLNDIGCRLPVFASSPIRPRQISHARSTPLTVTCQLLSRERVDDALLDGIARRLLRRRQSKVGYERACRAAVGGHYGIGNDARVPLRHAQANLRIAFAAGR